MGYDLIVVGGGVLGLAHAYHAVRAGHRVLVLDRSARAVGASVRNFGMVWPIGQPAGEMREMALRSREHWRTLASDAGFWLNECGSLHLAYREDEAAVMREFVAIEREKGSSLAEWVAPEEAWGRSDGINPEGLIGALWSPTECAVNPPRAIVAIAEWIGAQPGAEIRFSTPVSRCGTGFVETASGETIEGDRVVVCTGDDFRTLYPEQFACYPLVRCKLQMLATAPQPGGYALGPHLAGGLTLRHYASFKACPSLGALDERVRTEQPEIDRWGVHVMAAQHETGELILGDSHEYGDAFEPWCREEVDSIILRELSRFLVMRDPTITRRWFGVYAKARNERGVVDFAPEPGVRVVTGVGGAGMTLSFGLAERVVAEMGLLPTAAV